MFGTCVLYLPSLVPAVRVFSMWGKIDPPPGATLDIASGQIFWAGRIYSSFRDPNLDRIPRFSQNNCISHGYTHAIIRKMDKGEGWDKGEDHQTILAQAERKGKLYHLVWIITK